MCIMYSGHPNRTANNQYITNPSYKPYEILQFTDQHFFKLTTLNQGDDSHVPD